MSPRYPIYVPSKSRFENCLTAKFLERDGVPFFLVVEPEERKEYVKRFGAETVLELPFSNPGSVIPARNWILEHSKSSGAKRHWQLDDNILRIRRLWKGKRIPCDSGTALAAVEDFTDRYENVAISGMNYQMFAYSSPGKRIPPFFRNTRVYSCSLVLNSLPNRWRGRYNEDTDICLQVLADGWCTLLVNVFMIEKLATMTVKGGNTETLYKGDGRLRMARSLERLWPGVVTVGRRFKRPQHIVVGGYRGFNTELKLKPGIDLATLKPNEYGLKLRKIRPDEKRPRKRA